MLGQLIISLILGAVAGGGLREDDPVGVVMKSNQTPFDSKSRFAPAGADSCEI